MTVEEIQIGQRTEDKEQKIKEEHRIDLDELPQRAISRGSSFNEEQQFIYSGRRKDANYFFAKADKMGCAYGECGL